MPPRQRAADAFAKVGHAEPVTEASAPPEAATLPPPPDLDDALLARWRHSLSATARKVAAADARARAAQADWGRLVADARAAGIPERLVVAAAADAGLDIPGSE